MPLLGSFCVLFALALSAYSFIVGIIGVSRKDYAGSRLAETARRAGMMSFLAVTGASFALVWAAMHNDFSLAYILDHSNSALPTPYKFAALWSGQEGSLLLWAWLLRLRVCAALRHKVDVRLFASASTILAGVQVFFLLLVNFAANPFGLWQGAGTADGNGLNPLLQYPEMVIHPPMLYLGYVGFTVPFAFALGALIMRYPGEKWIHITRRWTMVTWLFLTCGILLGAHWAYSVLGWGGYWGWDPVENASLHAMAHRHRFSALGDDAGEARHDEDLERVADLLHLHAVHPRHVADALRRGQFRARLRAVLHRHMVLCVPRHRASSFASSPSSAKPRPSEVGAQAGIAGLPRVELPVQQPDAAGGLLHRAVGHAVPGAL